MNVIRTIRSRRLLARVLSFAIVLLAAAMGSPAARSSPPAPGLDPMCSWNELALKTVRVKQGSDAVAARLYAMVNVAIYDAVNGIMSRQGEHTGREHALVPSKDAPPQGDLYAAASSAAHAVLAGEFPDLATGFPDSSPGYDAQLQTDLAVLGPGGRTSAGQEWGSRVGQQVRAARANDGSTPRTSVCSAPRR